MIKVAWYMIDQKSDHTNVWSFGFIVVLIEGKVMYFRSNVE